MAEQTNAPVAFPLQETVQAVPNGQNIGYIRVSTVEQNTARQLDGVKLDKVFTDKCTGKEAERQQLQSLLEYVRAGDVLHVHSIDRLARNLMNLQRIVKQLHGKGVTVVFHKERLVFDARDNGNPLSSLVLQMLGAFAEFELACIKERQREGIERAKAEGRFKGRPCKLNEEQQATVRQLHTEGVKVAEIARRFNISRPAIYRIIDNKDA